MFKKFSFISLLALSFFQVCYWVTVRVPKCTWCDTGDGGSRVVWEKRGILETIAFVNGYLWFAIGLICFIFFIINGIKLVMARGDKNDFKKVLTSFLGTGVGIVVCFLSYSLVRLIINLF